MSTRKSPSAQFSETSEAETVFAAPLAERRLVSGHHNPSSTEVITAESDTLSSSSFDFSTTVETGLRLAHVISASSFQIASNFNRTSTEYAGRSISATANLVAARVGSFLEGLYPRSEVVPQIQAQILTGSSGLKNAVASISNGVDKALSVASELTSSGIDVSLKAIKRVDSGIDAALISSGLRTNSFSKRHGLLQAANTVLSAFGPLAVASPLQLGRAIGALSMLQEETQMPYPPSSFTVLNLNERKNRDFMNDLVYRFRQTLAAYTPCLLRLCKLGSWPDSSGALIHQLLGLDADAVMLQKSFSEIHHPAHFVLLDHSSRSICVVIRGSTEAADVLTDLSCEPDELHGSHFGMQRSAEAIDKQIRQNVHQLCKEYPNYKVVVEGHSLGGGTASLLCRLWLDDPLIAGTAKDRIHAYSFGPPCCLPSSDASALRPYVTSIVYGKDIVSRASRGSTQNLNNVLLFLCSRNQIPLPSSSDSLWSDKTKTPSSTSYKNVSVRRHMLNRSEECLHEAAQARSISSNSFYSTTGSLTEPTACSGAFEETSIASSASSSLSTCSESLSTFPMERSQPEKKSNSRNSFLESHLQSLTTTSLLQQLKVLHSLPDSTTLETRMFWKSQLRLAAAALQTLHVKDGIMCPAGRVILVLPKEQYILTGNPCPQYLTGGGAVVLDLDDDAIVEMASEILLTRDAFTDHVPQSLAIALGVKFGASDA